MSIPQLHGEVEERSTPDDRDLIIKGLREQIRDLDDQARSERQKAVRIEAGVRELRDILKPLYGALQAVFGEVDAMGIADSPVSVAQNVGTTTDPRWQSFKQAYPGVAAQIIDALLVHKEMGITQVAAFLKIHYNTAQGALDKLSKAGAVTKDGGRNGRYSLKI